MPVNSGEEQEIYGGREVGSYGSIKFFLEEEVLSLLTAGRHYVPSAEVDRKQSFLFISFISAQL